MNRNKIIDVLTVVLIWAFVMGIFVYLTFPVYIEHIQNTEEFQNIVTTIEEGLDE